MPFAGVLAGVQPVYIYFGFVLTVELFLFVVMDTSSTFKAHLDKPHFGTLVSLNIEQPINLAYLIMFF